MAESRDRPWDYSRDFLRGSLIHGWRWVMGIFSTVIGTGLLSVALFLWEQNHDAVRNGFIAGFVIPLGFLLGGFILYRDERRIVRERNRVLERLNAPFDTDIGIDADDDYGPDHGKAFYVVLYVSSEVSRAARARLISVTPLVEAHAAPVYGVFRPGLLHWSKYEGGGVTAFVTHRTRLDVLAFENNDVAGTFILSDPALRDGNRVHLSADWKIVVEIIPEGGGAAHRCTFMISRGSPSTSSEMFAISRAGTIYSPVVTKL